MWMTEVLKSTLAEALKQREKEQKDILKLIDIDIFTIEKAIWHERQRKLLSSLTPKRAIKNRKN
jgi:hypothetical protein